MSDQKMTVLTRASIIDLRAIALADPKKVWITHLNELVDEFSLETIEVSATFEKGFEFKYGADKDRSNDEHNSAILHQALPSLTPAQATDQRIWTTLALGEYKDYVLKRWAPAEGSAYPVAIKIFVKDTRSMMRDHSLARLWWRSHFANQVSNKDCENPLSLMYEYEDIPSEIASRAILTDPRVLGAYMGQVSRGLSAITPEVEAKGLSPKVYIQALGRSLNFLGGRFQLGAISDERLFQIFQIAHKTIMGRYSNN